MEKIHKIGRRKASIARIYLSKGNGNVKINNKDLNNYFSTNGLKSKIFNEVTHEFLELIYHGNDKLLIPVENLSLISKYGHSEISVALDRLGLQNWQQRKANVKKRIKAIAETLIKTAAERKLQKGEILIAKTFEYEKFSSEFEFTETSDQLKSIQQIENDLFNIDGDVEIGLDRDGRRWTLVAFAEDIESDQKPLTSKDTWIVDK